MISKSDRDREQRDHCMVNGRRKLAKMVTLPGESRAHACASMKEEGTQLSVPVHVLVHVRLR